MFDDSSICVKDKTSGNTLLHASSSGNVYPLAVFESSPSAFTALLDLATSWHRHLGHCELRFYLLFVLGT